jgi:hypothetical protein
LVGSTDGPIVGSADGSAVGLTVGETVGETVGAAVLSAVGSAVGFSVGAGSTVGSAAGAAVGSLVVAGACVLVGAAGSGEEPPHAENSIRITKKAINLFIMAFTPLHYIILWRKYQ